MNLYLLHDCPACALYPSIFFFFSSRRRHTRLVSDWSSDVCSSDLFFQDLHEGIGGGYPGETLEALWGLVWKGMVTNDGMAALRAYCERPATGGRAGKAGRRVHQQGAGFRSRRTTPPTGQGRWGLNMAAFAE